MLIFSLLSSFDDTVTHRVLSSNGPRYESDQKRKVLNYKMMY